MILSLALQGILGSKTLWMDRSEHGESENNIPSTNRVCEGCANGHIMEQTRIAVWALILLIQFKYSTY